MKARLFVSFLALSLATNVTLAKSQAPAPTSSVQSDVDAKMQQTVRSVDRSLSTLVTASRGGSAQRMPEPIGSTVAGPVAPPQASAPLASMADASILDKKVDIQWNGSARALLDGLSKKIGYRFTVTGNPSDPSIKLMAKQMPVRHILDMVAAQLHGSSDIIVSTSRSQITLAGRSK